MTVYFTIGGTNAASYNIIPSVLVNMIDPNTLISMPTTTALSNPMMQYNQATFGLQCSVASTVYWGIGIYPSILNTGALGFQARLISQGVGLMSNFTEPQDYYWRVYGVDYVTIPNIPLTKTVSGLKSNTNY
jgi:hypothetical protein